MLLFSGLFPSQLYGVMLNTLQDYGVTIESLKMVTNLPENRHFQSYLSRVEGKHKRQLEGFNWQAGETVLLVMLRYKSIKFMRQSFMA